MNCTQVKHFLKIILFSGITFALSSCGSDKPEEVDQSDRTGAGLKITVGVFEESGGTYTDTGKELIFFSEEECQTWARNAPGDTHDGDTHLHYNAAANLSYDEVTSTFKWTEFGPEIDQDSIDATCAAGKDGVDKTVNASSYELDKRIYLKIKKVE